LILSSVVFLHREVEYLGHIITPLGLNPNTKLVAAVHDYLHYRMSKPNRFLGLAPYYKPQFAKIAQPLHQLTCKEVDFQWTGSCDTQ